MLHEINYPGTPGHTIQTRSKANKAFEHHKNVVAQEHGAEKPDQKTKNSPKTDSDEVNVNVSMH